MKKNNQMKERICPRCGGAYRAAPALSRTDNQTLICPDCGTREALASMGVKCLSAEEAMKYTKWFSKNAKQIGRNVGVWLSDGVYYVDVCQRISTKKEAVEKGRRYNQLSIYYWGQRKESLEWL